MAEAFALDEAVVGPQRDRRPLVVDGAAKTYQGVRGLTVEALAPTDLVVDSGELVVVVGPSGCGKTTLLRLLAGFEQPTAGQLRFGADPIDGPDPERGFVFQQPALYPWLTVAGNVELGLRLQRVPKADRRRRVQEALTTVGLVDVAGAAPFELSGGMQQRCQLARVLVTDPPVLLMDEPFAALDALTRERLQGELHRLWREQRRTIVFVTHSVEEAVLLGTRAIVMSRRPGRVVLDLRLPSTTADAPADRRRDPVLLEVAEQLRSAIDTDG